MRVSIIESSESKSIAPFLMRLIIKISNKIRKTGNKPSKKIKSNAIVEKIRKLYIKNIYLINA